MPEDPGLFKSPRIARVLVILLCGAVAFWIAIGVTLSLTAAQSLPGVALAWWPSGSLPKIALGAAKMAGQVRSDDELASYRTMAREAGIQEPVNSYVLGLLASFADYRRDQASARTLFQLSEKMSRRNAVTQLWLIEDAVRREDVAGAIQHYDRAMRTSPELREMLLPILIDAAGEAEVRKHLLPRVAQRPRWWQDYAWKVAIDGESPELIDGTARALKLRLDDPKERMLAERLLLQLVRTGAYRRAIRLANLIEGMPGGVRSLRGGDFESDEGLRPFAWHLRDDASVRAYREAVPTGGTGLRITSSTGASGSIAWQMIGLRPGEYYLSGVAGNVNEQDFAQPRIQVSCADGQLLSIFSLPPSPDEPVNFRFKLRIPDGGCDVQRLTIMMAPIVDSDVWVDDLIISQ